MAEDNKNSAAVTAISDKVHKPLTRIQVKRNLMPISLKHTHEIMEAVKGKELKKAVSFLNKVLSKEAYIPFKKYPSKGHKHGVPAGFPQKATKQVISLIEELESNAKNMGFDESKILITGYSLGRGGYPRFSSGSVYRHGKRTNLVIYSLVDQEKKVVQKVSNKTEEKSENKNENVKEEKKDEVKKEEKVEEFKTEEKDNKESNKNGENNYLKAE